MHPTFLLLHTDQNITLINQNTQRDNLDECDILETRKPDSKCILKPGLLWLQRDRNIVGDYDARVVEKAQPKNKNKKMAVRVLSKIASFVNALLFDRSHFLIFSILILLGELLLGIFIINMVFLISIKGFLGQRVGLCYYIVELFVLLKL